MFIMIDKKHRILVIILYLYQVIEKVEWLEI